MAHLISFVKWIGVPGSAGFFALCCGAGIVAWIAGRTGRRIAKLWFVFVCFAYLAGGLPLVAYSLANRLPSYAPIWTPDSSQPDDILLVFSGDNPAERAKQARRVLDAATPRCVVVSGGPWFVRMVTAAGVERHRLTVDDDTSTTREQVARIGAWAEQCGARRAILVASTLSMPRIALLVRGSPVPVLLAPSSLDRTPAQSGVRALLPSLGALRLSRDALYEHFALAYYRQRNWVR